MTLFVCPRICSYLSESVHKPSEPIHITESVHNLLSLFTSLWICLQHSGPSHISLNLVITIYAYLYSVYNYHSLFSPLWICPYLWTCADLNLFVSIMHMFIPSLSYGLRSSCIIQTLIYAHSKIKYLDLNIKERTLFLFVSVHVPYIFSRGRTPAECRLPAHQHDIPPFLQTPLFLNSIISFVNSDNWR